MRNEFLKFGDRLEYLMKTKGYTGRGKSTRLAEAFIDEGYIIVEENNRKRKIQDTKRSIDIHLNYDRCVLQGIWMDRYCRFFECSADFLMGYIDRPTHEISSVFESTGLDDNAIETLISRKQLMDSETIDPTYIDILNDELSILSRIIIDEENILQQICEYVFGVTALTCCDDSKTVPSIPWWKRLPTIEADNGNIFAINLPIDKTTYRAIKIGYIQECLDSLAADTNNTGYFSSTYLSQPADRINE